MFNIRLKGRNRKQKQCIPESHILDFSKKINPLQWEKPHHSLLRHKNTVQEGLTNIIVISQ